MADLLKGFKTQNLVGRGQAIRGKKTVVDIEIKQEAHVNLDADAWAAAFAKSLTTIAKVNMLSGKTPGGKPLPAVKPATAERRKYREAQAARGGAPIQGIGRKRISLKSGQRKAKRQATQFFRSYQPKGSQLKAQGPFTPKAGPHAGVESGLLATSIVAVPSKRLEVYTSPKPERTDSLFRIFFADIRGVRDGHGTSPVDRAAATGALDFTGIEAQPQVHADMAKMAEESIARDEKELMASLKKLLSSLQQTVGAVEGLGG